MTCTCCPPDIRSARLTLNLPPCRSHASPRVIGILTFDHKTAPSLTIGSAATITKLTRNDRRRDKRLLK